MVVKGIASEVEKDIGVAKETRLDGMARSEGLFLADLLEQKSVAGALGSDWKSPLRYPGGKTRAARAIISYFPKNLKTLCSPFMGGGSIELLCARLGVRVYGYDSFGPLVDFWNELLGAGGDARGGVLGLWRGALRSIIH